MSDRHAWELAHRERESKIRANFAGAGGGGLYECLTCWAVVLFDSRSAHYDYHAERKEV